MTPPEDPELPSQADDPEDATTPAAGRAPAAETASPSEKGSDPTIETPASPPPATPAPAPTPPTPPAAVKPPTPSATPAPRPASANGPSSRPAPGASSSTWGPGGASPRPPARSPSVPRDPDDDFAESDALASRWVSLVTILGLVLIGIVAAQVTASILEGFLVRAKQMEPTGVKTDLLHRLGFPFGNLGPPAALFLVVGVVLVCLPRLLGEQTSSLQDRLVKSALVVVVALAVIIAIGSLLAVRNSLHEYTARGSDPPPYARVGFASFLLGTLGTSAAALIGALVELNARKKRGARTI